MATSILPGTTRSGGHARTYKLGAGLRMRGATSGRVGILPPATITSYDLTLPAALGASDKLLQVSSAGVVSLVDPVTIGGTGTELLYRGGASSAAAVAGSSWDGTTLTFPGRFVNANGYGFTASGTCTFHTLQGGTTSVAYIGSGGIYVGSPAATSATPAAGYLRGTGGSGTNVVGGTLYIGPGPSTGNATPSAVVVQSSVAGTSGSTAQTLVDTLTVANGKLGVGIAPSYFPMEIQHASAAEMLLTVQSGTCSIYFQNGTYGSAAAAKKGVIAFGTQSGSERYIAFSALNAAAGLVEILRLRGSGLASLVGDFAVASTNYHYWGASDVDGSWRIGRSGNDIVIERRESGVWVTKSTISA